MTALEPITKRPETLTDRVYEGIRLAIVTRQLAPGERVTEAALAAQLSVSKTPVREALLRLEGVGLVESDGHRAHVVISSATAVREAFEIRTALEVEAARLCTQRIGPEDLDSIGDLADKALRAAREFDRQQFRLFDRQFHLGIATAAGNQRLFMRIQDALDLVNTLRSRDAPRAEDSVSCAAEHLSVVDAMRNGDQHKAAEEMRLHILKVQSLVLKGFGQSEDVSNELGQRAGNAR